MRVHGALVWWVLMAASASAFGAELHLYTASDRVEAQATLREFEKDTGIRVRWVRLSSGEVLTRLRAERSNPQVSVWYGAPFLDFMIAAKEGLFEPYRPQTDAEIPLEARDPEWKWAGSYMGVIGFASNPQLLARRGLLPPQSWADLLKPEFKGDVSLAYAYTSGTAYTVIASLVQLMGEGPAMAYFKALDQQVHHYNRSGAACVIQVGLGEVGTCIAFTQDILSKGVQKGYPIVLTFPSEGTGYEYGGVALVKGAPEEALAKTFIDWIFSERGQSTLKRWNKWPVRSDLAKTMEPSPASVRRIAFDAPKAADERKRWVDAWRETTGQ